MGHLQTLGDIGEFALLARFDHATNPNVIIGPGDDAAEVKVPGASFLVATDILIEGQHFRRDWSTSYQVGAKAAAVNLSDINAMGGKATALTVAFAGPGDLEVTWVEEMRRGMTEEAAKVGAVIVGGDISASKEIIISITAIGYGEKIITRGGAQIGDTIAYTGTLGLARAGQLALSRGFRSPRDAVQTHCAPTLNYAAGPQAAAAGATAMIDVSDGLVQDLAHIARNSGVSIDIKSHALEISEPIATVAEALGVDPLSIVLAGGDDYALVASFPPFVALPDGWHVIGSVVSKKPNDVTLDGQPIELGGNLKPHEHFKP